MPIQKGMFLLCLLLPIAAAAEPPPTVQIELIALDPAEASALPFAAPVYARIRYRTDAPVRLALRPFRVGEYIDAGSVSGTIQEIGLFATELKTYDGIYVLAPNSELWNTPVKNFSRNPVRMAEIVVGIAYGDDISLAQQTMLDVITSDGRAIDDPAPAVFVDSLGDFSVNLKARYWAATSNWWASKLDITKAMKIAIEEKGLTIPFPQQEVCYIPMDQANGTGGLASRSATETR